MAVDRPAGRITRQPAEVTADLVLRAAVGLFCETGVIPFVTEVLPLVPHSSGRPRTTGSVYQRWANQAAFRDAVAVAAADRPWVGDDGRVDPEAILLALSLPWRSNRAVAAAIRRQVQSISTAGVVLGAMSGLWSAVEQIGRGLVTLDTGEVVDEAPVEQNEKTEED